MSTVSIEMRRIRRVPARFMRGGTSKGVFFLAEDLPEERAERDRLFLAVLGSPDRYGRQLDGLGGGVSSLSKAVIVEPASRGDADIDYTFAQVAVDLPHVDYGGTCGNLMAAVGPFAYEAGLLEGEDGEIAVRIHATNTGKIVISRFQVRGGEAEVDGDLELAGISGSGAPIRLEFLDPGGARTGRLLPGAGVAQELQLDTGESIVASLVDAANPCVFVAAKDLGLTGVELPDRINNDGRLLARLEAIRAAAGVKMGFGATAGEVGRFSQASPKVAIVAPPSGATTLDGRDLLERGADLSIRMVSMGKVHASVPLTGALCAAVAARISGTVVARSIVASCRTTGELRLGTPSGVVTVAADVIADGGGFVARSAVAYRTARCLMEGNVLVPSAALRGPERAG